ncbi:MAG: RsmE family RNA methyltransferase, partial [Erysipelotrichaceae bacterium]|nr:RsmE family RNA methyltransferase [Erysipelotrichaceae bacterium]
HNEEALPHLKDICAQKATTAINVFIGPEGGFSDDEVDYLTNHGFTSISLGKRIFRAETAAIAACIMLDTLGERHD